MRIGTLSGILMSAAIVWLGVSLAGCTRESKQEEPAGKDAAAVAQPTAMEEVEGVEDMEEEWEDDLVLVVEADPDEGEAPLTVLFSVESLMEDVMDRPKYDWDFGDGSPPSSEASPTHVYTNPGQYLATIRVIDGKGEKGWDEVYVEVDPPLNE